MLLSYRRLSVHLEYERRLVCQWVFQLKDAATLALTIDI